MKSFTGGDHFSKPIAMADSPRRSGMASRVLRGKRVWAPLILLASSAAAAGGPAAAAPQQPHQASPPVLSPADEAMLRWEEEAMRQGRFVCTNPNHHHRLSPQMHLLIEDDQP